MSDAPAGVRNPDDAFPVDVQNYPGQTYTTEPYGRTAGSGSDSAAKEVASQAGQAAADVKDTAKDQAARVGQEAKAQAANLASDVRNRVGEQARSQNDKLVTSIRQTADQLDEMRGDRGDSPAAAVVSRVADGGRQFADYLDRNGPEGVLQEVQDFARRRPGAFLATALAAGFVLGRLGKSVAKADPEAGAGKPATDSFVSNPDTTGHPAAAATTPGYPAGTDEFGTAPGYAGATEYASTGTGTPIVREEYVVDSPERPR